MKSFLLVLLLAVPAFADNAAVTLSWDPVPDLDIDHYRVRVGVASGQYTTDSPTTSPSYQLSLPVGIMEYAVVTAVNTSGVESVPTKELVFQVGTTVPPKTPTGLHRNNVAVTLQSSPDLRVWSDESVSLFAFDGPAMFWRLAINRAVTQ